MEDKVKEHLPDLLDKAYQKFRNRHQRSQSIQSFDRGAVSQLFGTERAELTTQSMRLQQRNSQDAEEVRNEDIPTVCRPRAAQSANPEEERRAVSDIRGSSKASSSFCLNICDQEGDGGNSGFADASKIPDSRRCMSITNHTSDFRTLDDDFSCRALDGSWNPIPEALPVQGHSNDSIEDESASFESFQASNSQTVDNVPICDQVDGTRSSAGELGPMIFDTSGCDVRICVRPLDSKFTTKVKCD